MGFFNKAARMIEDYLLKRQIEKAVSQEDIEGLASIGEASIPHIGSLKPEYQVRVLSGIDNEQSGEHVRSIMRSENALEIEKSRLLGLLENENVITRREASRLLADITERREQRLDADEKIFELYLREDDRETARNLLRYLEKVSYAVVNLVYFHFQKEIYVTESYDRDKAHALWDAVNVIVPSVPVLMEKAIEEKEGKLTSGAVHCLNTLGMMAEYREVGEEVTELIPHIVRHIDDDNVDYSLYKIYKAFPESRQSLRFRKLLVEKALERGDLHRMECTLGDKAFQAIFAEPLTMGCSVGPAICWEKFNMIRGILGYRKEFEERFMDRFRKMARKCADYKEMKFSDPANERKALSEFADYARDFGHDEKEMRREFSNLYARTMERFERKEKLDIPRKKIRPSSVFRAACRQC